MISMVDKNLILLRYYRDGESIRSISKEISLSRNTVRRYLRSHNRLIESSGLENHLSSGLSTKPSYNSSTRKKRRFNSSIRSIIDECLEKNQQKRTKGLHKQCMKKIDIHHFLLSKGHNISYTTVCNYIRKTLARGKEAFIKQVYSPGVSCEFDWGAVKLYLDGKLQRLNLAVFTSCYSNYRWAKLFHRQDTLAFMQSHVDFFSQTQGVYKELVYDNMRVAVARFIGPTEKQATSALLELSNYYKFGFRFCNVRKGNEKGHVERSVEYIRRKAFCITDAFSSLEKANVHLLQTCSSLNDTGQRLKQKSATLLFKQEKEYLYPFLASYKCFHEQFAKADKYATIILYGNRYSVPDNLVGKLLKVHVFAEKIEVYLNQEKVCSHTRCYGCHVWNLSIEHYLNTLYYKPGALRNALAFDKLETKVKDVYQRYFKEDPRDFVSLLHYCKKQSIAFNTIEDVILKLQKICPTHISKDKVVAILDKAIEEKQTSSKAVLPINEIELYARASLNKISGMLY